MRIGAQTDHPFERQVPFASQPLRFPGEALRSRAHRPGHVACRLDQSRPAEGGNSLPQVPAITNLVRKLRSLLRRQFSNLEDAAAGEQEGWYRREVLLCRPNAADAVERARH